METQVLVMFAAAGAAAVIGLYEIVTRTVIFRDTKGADAETIRTMAP